MREGKEKTDREKVGCTCPSQWCVSPRCFSHPTPASSISRNLKRDEPACGEREGVCVCVRMYVYTVCSCVFSWSGLIQIDYRWLAKSFHFIVVVLQLALTLCFSDTAVSMLIIQQGLNEEFSPTLSIPLLLKRKQVTSLNQKLTMLM